MASRVMFRDQQAHLGRGILPAVLLSVVATLAVVAPLAIFFRPDNIDPQVSATLQYIRAGQQQTTSGIEAINDRPAAEKLLAQTRGTKAINNSLAAEHQFIALSARLSTLQDAMTRMLRDNADLAQQLRATQTQMAQDNALVAEQLKALTQIMARRPGVLAKGSDEGERRRRTITRKLMPEVGRTEVSGALAARRPAGLPAAGGR
jgi:septal ring factor EnvC (AmiA/AmiB activator)